MNQEIPQRSTGPHAPLPAAIAAGTESPRIENLGVARANASADDPRARASERAAQLREHLGTLDEGTDEFYIDPRLIPDGWDYEYKRLSVLGQPDLSHQVSIAQHGWEAVPRSRHPQLMPENLPGNTIEKKGMILMERPLEITREVKQIELRKAREQVRGKEMQLAGTPAGHLPRDADPRTAPRINKTFESIPIPEK